MSGDDGLTCDCCRKRGWAGLPEQPLDGQHWSVDVAAAWLGIPAGDLRDLIRIVKLEPTGTAKMAAFRRSGRQPRVYASEALIMLHEMVYTLRQALSTQDRD